MTNSELTEGVAVMVPDDTKINFADAVIVGC